MQRTLSDTYNCPDIKSRKKDKTIENITDIMTSSNAHLQNHAFNFSDLLTLGDIF